ncbi:MAG: hypothetical protein QM741_16290 [Rudaea sp.]|uniref:hypothetical protein n=1 Tax=Rudaea sp. TaxID=2136325 RepID=UPI0039E5B1CD
MSQDKDCNCHKTSGAASAAQAPSLLPTGTTTATNGDSAMNDSIPTLIPGAASTGVGGSDNTAASGTAAPSLEPNAAALSDGGQTVWNNDKKATALWSINQNRNSWVYVAGVGWKKLANNSDSAVVALTVLAANAKQSQGVYNYRDEADGMIHETYVW